MIILACDHAGYELKEEIKAFFNKQNNPAKNHHIFLETCR